MQLTIDFETRDQYLDQGMGEGWVYGDIILLGAALKIDDGVTEYITDLDKIKSIASQADILVCHNSSYDCGCLIMMGLDIKGKVIRDTEIGSRLLKNTLQSHSLDSVARHYLNECKSNQELIDEAFRIGLVKKKKDGTFYKTTDDQALYLIKTNMDVLQAANLPLMAKYACQDVELTYKLDKLFLERVGKELYEYYSSTVHVVLAMRKQGVRVDLKRAEEVGLELDRLVAELESKITATYGDFNYASSTQLAEKLKDDGLAIPTTELGNESVTTAWMKKQDNQLCEWVAEVKKLKKARTDFVDNIFKYQRHGRVHPLMNLLRARTGRFSCTAPNLQQIPARDEYIGPLMRSLYLPEEGENWYCLDFAAQEPRLQVHYAAALTKAGSIKAPSAITLADAYQANPALDSHQLVADMINASGKATVSRKQAKTINLGISYGMGKDKLAKSLGLTVEEAVLVRKAYNRGADYLGKLSDYCKDMLEKRGYIKTIGGRKSYAEEVLGRDLSYKALNSLIQGSSADQTIASMLWAYKEGMIPLTVVHDEINISAPNKEKAERLKFIMENAVPLLVPSLTEIGEGANWAEAK